MERQKLTKRIVDAVQPTTRDQFIWDSELPGFGLRVRPGGSKTFSAQYRAGGGRTGQSRRYTIGRYGVLTVDEARHEARKVLLSVAQGHDPSGARHTKRQEMTIAELIEHYGKTGADHLRERNRRMTLARLHHHVVPLIGTKRIGDVRIGDVEQMMRDVGVGKTAKDDKAGHRKRIVVRGGLGAATRAVRDLSAVFTFAIRQSLLIFNPCVPVRKRPDQRRTRFLSLEELGRLGGAFRDLENEGVNPKAIAIMRLWALTGCRRDEIARLKWSEIDFEFGCLRLTASKTGRSTRPLAKAALDILAAQTKVEGSTYVFPGGDNVETFYQGTKLHWDRAIDRAKLPGVTPHTLRHTIGSASVSSGETLAMTGSLLGHVNQLSTSIYAHMQQDPARRAADRVVGPIAAALGLREAAEVVEFKSAVGSKI